MNKVAITIIAFVLTLIAVSAQAGAKDEWFASKCFTEIKANELRYTQNKVKSSYTFYEIGEVTSISNSASDTLEVIGVSATIITPWGEELKEWHTCYVDTKFQSISLDVAYEGMYRYHEYWGNKQSNYYK